jgi:hypothetical protein
MNNEWIAAAQRRQARFAKAGVALGASAVLVFAIATPAQAADGGGSRSCSSFVRVSSTSNGPAAPYFLQAHSAAGVMDEWSYPGYKQSLSSAYSTSWSVYTTFSFSSYGASCSGIS